MNMVYKWFVSCGGFHAGIAELKVQVGSLYKEHWLEVDTEGA